MSSNPTAPTTIEQASRFDDLLAFFMGHRIVGNGVAIMRACNVHALLSRDPKFGIGNW
ncbi:hypothetical protein [Aquabacterium sp.]|uniref:hypothetical protein n=1 Tax=Aquabacterium sp. TaxID=1872578 RepID=UPI0025C42148|nr:hypothetical protein [Aquabacterium sp.]